MFWKRALIPERTKIIERGAQQDSNKRKDRNTLDERTKSDD
jgi:hypothetical protein